MTWDDIITIVFLGLGLVGLFAIIIASGISIDKENKERKKAESSNAPGDGDEYVPEEMYATVIDMHCSSGVVGYRNPKAVRSFFILFELDDGRRLELPVSESYYEGFEVGQKGLLTLIDHELYSFDVK